MRPLAVFGVAIAKVFKAFLMAFFPSLVQIPFTIGIGTFIHGKGKNLLPSSLNDDYRAPSMARLAKRSDAPETRGLVSDSDG